MDRKKFRECWSKTEVIREYHQMLFTFGNMELPYVFAAEQGRFKDRTVVRRGVVQIQKPHIILPGYYGGPEFKNGFEHTGALPPEAVYLFRMMGLPYSHINNRPLAQEQIEYRGLQAVLDELNQRMESQEDSETGLIKGVIDGPDISLMRYSLGMMIRSAPGNVKEFFDRMRRQRGEPIGPDEKISDEEIRRLLG